MPIKFVFSKTTFRKAQSHIYNLVHTIDELENVLSYTAKLVENNLTMTREEIFSTRRKRDGVITILR